MIAPLVIALLVGASSAIPCSDIKAMLLGDYPGMQEGNPTKVDLTKYEKTFTLQYLTDRPVPTKNMKIFTVPSTHGVLPEITDNDGSYEIFAFRHSVWSELKGAGGLTVVFTKGGGKDFIEVVIPLKSDADEGETINEDLSQIISKLLSGPQKTPKDGISTVWLHELLSKADPVTLTPESAYSKTFMTDCVAVGQANLDHIASITAEALYRASLSINFDKQPALALHR